MQGKLLGALLLCTTLPGCFEPAAPPSGMTATGDTDAAQTGGVQDASSGTDPTDVDPSGPETTSVETTGVETTGMSSTGEDDEDIEFFDDFDADQGQWTYEDDVGAQKEGPGNWRFAAGDLIQDADISGPETASPSLGTYAIGGDFDWDAYLVEVSYTADDDGVAGVLCHVGAEGDFIRFDLDHETGIVRLARRASGVLSLIEEVEVFTVPMELNIERTLTLDCGSTYRGFVDGVMVIEGGDGTGAEGGVGMYASSIGDGPSGLRFHMISVNDD